MPTYEIREEVAEGSHATARRRKKTLFLLRGWKEEMPDRIIRGPHLEAVVVGKPRRNREEKARGKRVGAGCGPSRIRKRITRSRGGL